MPVTTCDPTSSSPRGPRTARWLARWIGFARTAAVLAGCGAPASRGASGRDAPDSRSDPVELSAALPARSKPKLTERPAPLLEHPGDDPVASPSAAADGDLAFARACDGTNDELVTIAAVGDLMGHREIQRQAYASSDGFRAVWSGIEDLLAAADITYGNLEAPTAPGLGRDHKAYPDPGRRFDNKVYSGYARFNIHPSILDDLVASGFDVVSTANNHALDRDAEGVDRTLDQLRRRPLKSTGTRPQASDAPWYAITEAKGVVLAWVACTLHTNFGQDHLGQVLHCFAPTDPVRTEVARLRRRQDVDAVIVTPHWGKEYAHDPSPRQRRFAQRWLDAGAIAIVGSHPHVVQPWEIRQTEDGREGLVAYSLGNFFSHQRTLNRRSTAILYLALHKANDGETRIAGAGYIPLHVRMEGDKDAFFVEAVDRVGGPAEARELVAEQLGEANLLDPTLPLNLRPHCADR